MSAALDRVLSHPGIWRGDRCAQTAAETVPTGFAELDRLLPGGGWPRGALTEILIEREGIGELSLLMPALVRLSSESGWLIWVAPPHVPYAPALAAAGLGLSRLMLARTPSATETWWTAEQALRSGACSAVLAWIGASIPRAARAPSGASPTVSDDRALRRLQLAAETGRSWCVLLRPAAAARERSPAALRMQLAPAASGLAVHIIKRRGGPVAGPVPLALP